MSESPRRWLGLVGAAASTAAIATLFGLSWAQLPEPMATHWPLSGPPDGAMPRRFICAALVAVPWAVALWAWFTKSRESRATLTALTFLLGGTVTSLAWSLVTVNRGAEYWRDAGAIPWHHSVIILIATMVPGLIGLRRWSKPRGFDGEVSALDLTPEQRAVWLGSAHNRWIWLIGLLPLVAMLFTPRTSSSMAITTPIIAAVTLVLADAFSSVRVKVDRYGVHIKCGNLGLIRRNVALDAITRAEVFELAPLAHGGWGYRGSLWLMKRAAIVVRGGAALRLALAGGKELSVTVDNPDDGASLINGMVKLR